MCGLVRRRFRDSSTHNFLVSSIVVPCHLGTKPTLARTTHVLLVFSRVDKPRCSYFTLADLITSSFCLRNGTLFPRNLLYEQWEIVSGADSVFFLTYKGVAPSHPCRLLSLAPFIYHMYAYCLLIGKILYTKRLLNLCRVSLLLIFWGPLQEPVKRILLSSSSVTVFALMLLNYLWGTLLFSYLPLWWHVGRTSWKACTPCSSAPTFCYLLKARVLLFSRTLANKKEGLLYAFFIKESSLYGFHCCNYLK